MKKRIFLIVIAALIIFQGCTKQGEKEDIPDTLSSKADIEMEEENDMPEETIKADPTVLPTPEPTPELVLPLVTNNSGKVLIQTVSGSLTYPYTSYIITSSNGESIVLDPTAMPAVSIIDINPAAIISTHSHPDHVDSIFTGSYDCPKLLYTVGEIEMEDFFMHTIPSSHSGDNVSEKSGNVIVIIEVDGLRIAHMGDVGQTFLTEEQLQELGDIDIAFMQFENSYSSMSLSNEKGFILVEQLNPKVIIPTHYSEAALPVLEEKYGEITEFDNILEISEEDVPEQYLSVYRILNTHKYK